MNSKNPAPKPQYPTPMIIGIDTGGTFTDFVFHDGSDWSVRKILSTPENPAEAVIQGLAEIPGAKTAQIVHGSTVVTNAVLEKKGARTALVTNAGFEDVIRIGRQQRSRLYDPFYRHRPPLVPDARRFGVNGRINARGEIVDELKADELDALIEKLAADGVESVAVSCLFSFANPAHERKIAEILARLNVPVSLSHRIVPEFREYERTSTTVINAYVAPRIQHYIREMAGHIPRESLRIMQSNGGSISADRAAQEPVRTILSGPAAGVVGARRMAAAAGHHRLITFDMGGTSTDVSLLDGRLPFSVEASIDGFPVNVPMLDIHTVGAGGGSIARMDAAGALKVGPESAGADPGPMCYGSGSRITVTDANLFLGRLQPDFFLGGGMPLQTNRLNQAMQEMTDAAGLAALDLARGILAVANAAMERAIRKISVQRGLDPAEFTLAAFGGAGGMHAAFLARLLNIPRVFIPRHPGILSAMGMLTADIIRDNSQTVMIEPSNLAAADITERFRALEARTRAEMADEGLTSEAVQIKRFADMRYKGQSYEIPVDFDADFIQRFHKAHETLYGFCDSTQAVELVNIRVRAACPPPEKPALQKQAAGEAEIAETALLGRRPVNFEGKPATAPVIDRNRLRPGNRIEGPALVVEYSSSIVIPPGAEAEVDEWGNVIVGLE